jgi:O-antigen/teichoic acid export membrane protein
VTAPALDAASLPPALDRHASPGGIGTLRAHLRVPLFRNAYALITSTMLTTGFGMLSWIAAARLYSVEDVGRGQSAVNTLILLAGFGNLRLMNVLTRFLPRARERTAWLVRRCYELTTLATLVVCAAYVVLPDDVAPLGELMGPTPFAGLWLVAGVWSFALFTLQDGVLTGLRSAAWVPIQNGVHSVVKLALVVGLAGVLPAGGIYASWVVPAALLLVPVQLRPT